MVVTCDTGTQYSLDDISVDIQLEPPCLISTPKKTPGDDVPLAEPPSPSPFTLSSPVKSSSDYKPSFFSILDAAEETNDEESIDEELVLLCTFLVFHSSEIFNTTLVWHGSRVVERRAFGRRDQGSIPPPPFQSLGNFVYPTLPVSFGRDSKSHWSLLSGVYARRSKRSHANIIYSPTSKSH